jgi:hypothetical protein
MSALDIGSRVGETGLVGCPYCGRLLPEARRRDAGGAEIACPRCSTLPEWHGGVFRAEVLRLEGKRTRPPREGLPGRFSLRCLGDKGPVERIFFTFTEIDIKKGDTISLSYRRVPRGVMRKTWSGSYSEYPSLLINSRTRLVYRI